METHRKTLNLLKERAYKKGKFNHQVKNLNTILIVNQ